jgi:ATP-dependent RNA helicase SUPV3L1/SUV3
MRLQGLTQCAGTARRAIRIDMLERLADMLRSEDSRGGFEAKADMLSITGMTLEQFADLMQGLGYKAEKGERAKVKAAPVAEVVAAEVKDEAQSDDVEPVPDATSEQDTPEDVVAKAPVAEETLEQEVFYSFTWGRVRPSNNRPRAKQDGDKPRGKGKPRGKPRGKKPGDRPQQGTKTFTARPPRKEKPIDPDNPFAAALMGLKDNK